MTPVHCADDMPEIERLRARVAELEAAAAERAAIDASADQTYRDSLAACLTDASPCGHEESGHWCWSCVHALNDSPFEAEQREASEVEELRVRVADLEAAAAQRAIEDNAREREVDELRGENADLRRALEAVRTSHPGDYVVTYAHPNEALRAEVQALRALVASLRADVRAISDSIDADAARASAEARRVSGYARAAALTPERRREIARNAGRARWAKVRDVLEDSQPMEVETCD